MLTANQKNYAWWAIYLRGIAIGLADLVPGVSGGTIAFITGIYTRLLAVLRHGSELKIYLLLLRGKFKEFWQSIDGNFVVCLLAGVGTAILLGVEILHNLLTNQLSALLAFFFGLTLAASVQLFREFKLGLACPRTWMCFSAGVLLAIIIQAFPAVEFSTAPSLLVYFFAGTIALCVMILPGISGSLMLLLLGVYPFIVAAVRDRDLGVILVFASGGIIGLLLFARLLLKLLRTAPKFTGATLIGIMCGALPRLWPWRVADENTQAILAPPAWPQTIDAPQLLLATVCFVTGLLIIQGVSFATKQLQN